MWAIYINNIKLDFDGQISGTDYNPRFWEFSPYTFPFNLPLKKNNITNKKAIDYEHLIASKKNNEDYYDTKIICPYRNFTGKSKFIKFVGDYAQFYFVENYNFWQIIRETKLNDIDRQWFPRLVDDYGSMPREYDDYVFAPIYNSVCGDNLPYGLDDNFIGTVNDNVPLDIAYTYRILYQPLYKLHAFVRILFEYFGYTVTSNVLATSAYFKKMVLYNNFCPYIFGSRPSAFTTIDYISYVNNEVRIGVQDTSVFEDYMVVLLSDLIGADELNNKIFGFEITDIQEIKLTNVNSEGYTPYISGGLANARIIETNLYEYPTNQIWPNVTILEFLKQLSSWGIDYIIDNQSKKVQINLFKNLYNKHDFEDITDITQKISENTKVVYDSFEIYFDLDSTDSLVSENYQTIDDTYTINDAADTFDSLPIVANPKELRQVIDENLDYYIYKPDMFLQNVYWEFFSSQNNIYKTEGENPYQHKIYFLPLFVTTRPYDEGISKTMVNIQQAINLWFMESKTDSPFRLFFYYGYQPISEGETYPLSSNSFYDHNGDPIDGYDLDLTQLHGDNGIYEKLLRELVNWEVNYRKDAKAKINWKPQQFNNFDWNKKYRIKNTNYIIKFIPWTLDFKENKMNFGLSEICKI